MPWIQYACVLNQELSLDTFIASAPYNLKSTSSKYLEMCGNYESNATLNNKKNIKKMKTFILLLLKKFTDTFSFQNLHGNGELK